MDPEGLGPSSAHSPGVTLQTVRTQTAQTEAMMTAGGVGLSRDGYNGFLKHAQISKKTEAGEAHVSGIPASMHLFVTIKKTDHNVRHRNQENL